MCSCIQRTVYEAGCVTGSAVYDSASSFAAVQSVRGFPAALKRRTVSHRPQHFQTRSVNLHQAPRHSAVLV